MAFSLALRLRGYFPNELILEWGVGLRQVYIRENWQIKATVTGHSIILEVNNMQYYAVGLK